VAGHDSPFDYLVGSFFEGEGWDTDDSLRSLSVAPVLDSRLRGNDGDGNSGDGNSGGGDCLVWSCRGGGKTQLGAIATLLDLVFKPGIQVRILGGSLEQSGRMYGYLRAMLEGEVFGDLVKGRMTGKRVELVNGSVAEVLSQSERSVRGQRVQVLRCDEVELFDPEVWAAGQLVTRSGRCGEIEVAGRVEGLSTMHRPFGLMQRLIEESAKQGRRVFRWSVVDILERCPAERVCEECSLNEECGGLAKAGRGFVRIEDAIRQKSRVDRLTWESEMLCMRAKRSEVVYAEFDPRKHVREFTKGVPSTTFRSASGRGTEHPLPNPPPSSGEGEGIWVGGVDFGYRSPTVVLWARVDEEGVVQVVDELVMREMTTTEHLEKVEEKGWPGLDWVGADPAGHQMSEHTGSSVIARWKEAGFAMRTRAMGIEPGISAVRQRLRSADGRVSLFVDPCCRELIRALSMYHYPVGKLEDSRPVKDGHDHAADALRYLVVNLDRMGLGRRGY